MAKKFCLSVTFLFLLSAITKAQTGLDFVYNFSNNPSYIYSFIGSTIADSNQFITAGITASDSGKHIHSFLGAFNYKGNLSWQSDLLFPGVQNGVSGTYILAKQNNETYILGGEQLDFAINPKITVHQPFLYFFNKNGDSLGFLKYTDSFISRDITSLIIDDKQNILVAGLVTGTSVTLDTNHFDATYGTYFYDSVATWLAKYDKNGRLLWDKKFLWSTQNEYVDKIVISADGQHYVIAGYFYDDASNSDQTFLLKTDTAGNEVWHKSLPRQFIFPVDDDIDIIAAKRGGYYFMGTYTEFNPAPHYTPCSRFYYGRLDENGDTLWTKSYSNDTGIASMSIGLNIAYCHDGNLLMTGNNNYTSGNMPVLFKADTSGNLLWFREQLRGGAQVPIWQMATQFLTTLSVAPDGRILTCGTLENPYVLLPYFDTIGLISRIVLTDTNGMRFPGDTVLYNVLENLDYVNINTQPASGLSITIYPNPVTDFMYIQYSGASPGVFSICDVLGRSIYNISLNDANGVIKVKFPYPPGMYLYNFTVLGVIKAEGKIIKR